MHQSPETWSPRLETWGFLRMSPVGVCAARHRFSRRQTVMWQLRVVVSLWFIAPSTTSLAQKRTTLIVGAGNAATGAFLRGVQVRLTPLNILQYTDSMGQARLSGIPPGTYTIQARRIGFDPLSAPVLVRTEDSLEVTLLMRATIPQLDTVVVSRMGVAPSLREFENRRGRGVGQFITRAQIDSAPGASFDAVIAALMRGVRVVTDAATGTHVVTDRAATEGMLNGRGGGPCRPVIYLDGVLLADDTGYGPDISMIDLALIGGVEFYEPSEIPVQYRGAGAQQNAGALSPTRSAGRPAPKGGRGGSPQALGALTSPSCGAMLIWTRP